MKVAVIGLGSWGTAVTGLVAPHVDCVGAWAHSGEVAQGVNETHHNPRYLKDYRMADTVEATTSLKEAIEGAEAVFLVVPSPNLAQVSAELAPYISATTPILVLTKGIEDVTGCLMTQVVGDAVGNPERIACLSGPNHAEEICQGKISAAVVAAPTMELASKLQQLVLSPTFRVYVTQDMTGVEVCGAVKNIIAIACGAAAKLDVGDNAIAVLMTRGLAEISRIVVALGGDAMTCMGLAGMGDLIATCTSRHSRNRSYGQALVSGIGLKEYEQKTHMVVEGAHAARSVYDVCCEKGIEAPITSAVHAILYEHSSVDGAINTLLGRSPHVEFYGIRTRE